MGMGWAQWISVLGVLAAAGLQWSALEAAPGGRPPFGGVALAEVELHGSTPSLAWSRDGRRLAINAAYEYYGFDEEIRRHRARLGIWVLELASGQARQVAAQQGYHPFWLTDETLGFACSGYEDCPEGVFLVPARGGALTPLGKLATPHRSLLARDGRVLVFQGYSGGSAWVLVDPRTGAVQPALGLPADSWSTPELAVDQCPQRAGGVEARWEGDELVVATPSGEFGLVARPFSFAQDYPEGHGGPVAPCLSPDGRQVAYLTPGQDGYRVRVVAVPTGPGMPPSPTRPLESGGGRAGPAALVEAGPAPLEALASLGLHGSTPCLAWSPDGRRVVANAAHEYYGHDGEIAQAGRLLGVWLLTPSGEPTQVFSGQAYHPFWLDTNQVGWGVSEYEQGQKGIWIAPARAGGKPRRLGKLQGVHRTLLARDGRVLAYVGFPEYLRWVRVDPRSGNHLGAGGLAAVGSWDDPAGHYQDQCLARAGAASLASDPEHGFVLEVRGARHRLAERPLFRYGYESGAGPVRPCLSPDGSLVAFFLHGEGTPVELRIARVPAP